MKDPKFKDADCKPEKVKVLYYNKTSILKKGDKHFNAFAYAYINGGFKKQATASSSYCTEYWNTAKLNRQLSPGVTREELRCMIFTHEYGHLLGYNHDPKNTANVMYNGYVFDDIGGVFGSVVRVQSKALFVKMQQDFANKSICGENIPHNKI